MDNVIDLFWSVVEHAKRISHPTAPIRSPLHPLNSLLHPLRSVTHPLRSVTHPLNSITHPNRGVAQIHELKKLLNEYFPQE